MAVDKLCPAAQMALAGVAGKRPGMLLDTRRIRKMISSHVGEKHPNLR